MPPLAQIQSGIALTGAADTLIQKLIVLRNNVFAHTSREFAVNPSRFKQELELEEQDVWALVNGALQTLNRYADLFFAQTYTRTIVGHDDYKSVLASLQRDWLAPEREIYEELKATGKLDTQGDLRSAAT